jgi:O-antigen ligase
MSSNSEAQNLTACIFCGLTLMLKFPRQGKWIVPALGLGAFFLYFTRGRTATIACILLSLFFIKRMMDRSFKVHTRVLIALAGLTLVAPALIVMGSQSGELAEKAFMMGRSDEQNTKSLSNRAPLWNELMVYAEKRPWQGYGFSTFWTSKTITLISAHQGWGVPNAHNTYLDQELSAGLISVVLMTIPLWGGLYITWARFRRNPRAETLLPPVMLTWLIATMFSESVPLEPFLPTFLAYIFLTQAMMPEGAAVPEETPELGSESCAGEGPLLEAQALAAQS